MTPGLQRIGAQPSPQGDAADLGHYASREDLAAQLGDREARQGHIGVTGQLAREPFNGHDDAGGKSGLRARLEALPQAGYSVVEKPVAPFAHDLPWRIESRGDEIVAESLGRQQDDLRANDVSIR
jgi:hypothetical protein